MTGPAMEYWVMVSGKAKPRPAPHILVNDWLELNLDIHEPGCLKDIHDFANNRIIIFIQFKQLQRHAGVPLLIWRYCNFIDNTCQTSTTTVQYQSN
ncbi:MAG: hypothetical protein COB00_04195 [Alcanivorax sp.]|nr:MAG: hypothetical protein COB00_04195 [Alcanivorax sp.]